MALPIPTPLGAAGDIPAVHANPATGITTHATTATSPAATNARAEANNAALVADSAAAIPVGALAPAAAGPGPQKTILRGKRGNSAHRQEQVETAVFDALPPQTQCMLRVEQIQQQMCQNIMRAFEQQQLLEDLDERAAFLENQSKQFKQTATALRKRFWWQDAKWTVFLVGLLALALLAMVVYITKVA